MWKQPKYLSVADWLKKMWCVHTTEYCTAVKEKEIPQYGITWINLEVIRPSEISRPQKNKFCSYKVCKIVKSIQSKKQSGGFQGLRESGNGWLLIKGHEISIKQNKEILEICCTSL